MSTTPYPGPYPTTISEILVHHITTTPSTARRTKPATQSVRRRPTRIQGYSLEILGHAIEYLVDSQLCLSSEAETRSSEDAAQILMRLSREVFAECRIAPAPVPFRERLLHLMGYPELVRSTSGFNE